MKVETISTQLTEIAKKTTSKTIKTNKRIEYYNIPCSFDIETSSFYKSIKMEKQAIMYVWQLNIDGLFIYGRTWEEFLEVYDELVRIFNTHEKKRLIIYVHNLSFEFQFIRKLFKWFKIFALEKRKPVQAITIDGIEFRCSYILSGFSLAKLGDQLQRYKVSKMVGDLDYSKMRHSKTPLTEKEMGYIRNDTEVVVAYIRECIENDGDITKIPLTKTGYVRNYCRNECFYEKPRSKSSKKYHNYRNLMLQLQLNVEEYKQLKRAFAGGFTHANPYYSRETQYNVDSFDFTSSYPYAMVSEKFPMSSPELITIKSEKEFRRNLKNYCCVFDIKFKKLKPKVYFENYISVSHCTRLLGYEENNGRVVSAEELVTTITEQDFLIIEKFYTWESFELRDFRRFRKDYLPKDLILSILELYRKKTELKDIVEFAVEYMVSKNMINAVFGMCVTDICRDIIEYDGNWNEVEPNFQECIDKYNKSKKRFLYYAWGIWITAYARKNLFTGIYEFGYDYRYSDTDSLKVVNKDKHMKYIEGYNNMVRMKLRRMCEHYDIDIYLTKPKNKNGKEKELGIWDWEGTYTRFKTLGAKRYLTEKTIDGVKSVEITVSGVNKKNAIKYLLDTYGDDVFNAFDNGLIIPATYMSENEELSATGKMTHTYIDEEVKGYVTDYLGKRAYYKELSGVHLENADYSLSMSEVYIDYLLGIWQAKE